VIFWVTYFFPDSSPPFCVFLEYFSFPKIAAPKLCSFSFLHHSSFTQFSFCRSLLHLSIFNQTSLVNFIFISSFPSSLLPSFSSLLFHFLPPCPTCFLLASHSILPYSFLALFLLLLLLRYQSSMRECTEPSEQRLKHWNLLLPLLLPLLPSLPLLLLLRIDLDEYVT
jgi:hypothetical protein